MVTWVLLAVMAAVPTASLAADAPALRAALHKATRVGVGRITAAKDFDYGRLRVYEINLARSLKPRSPREQAAAESLPPAETVLVVSLTDEPGAARPENGQFGVAFLRPLRRNSYMDEHLARGEYYAFVGGRDGWLGSPSPEQLATITRPVELLTGFSRRPDSAIAPTARREFVFALLAAPHPLLADDGIVSLSSIAQLSATISEPEIAVIVTALRNATLPVPLRQRLIEEIVAADLRQLIGTLQSLDDPALQRTAWAALRKMGVAPDDDAIREKLAHRTAAVRIAAARELLERDPAAGSRAVTSMVLDDPDKQVRLDVIEALGESGAEEAVAPLEKVFAAAGNGAGVEIRQAATRALLAIGGKAAADAFHRLAFVGTPAEQRYAAFALLSLGVGTDDPRVVDILERNPDEKMSEMILRGLPMGEHD